MSEPPPLRTSVAADLGSLADEFAAPAEHHPGPGARVGEHFELAGELGRGGMGQVYGALDRRLGRRVAIKLGLRGADVARMRREAVTLAQLAHPNVVTIYEIGEHAGAPFVAMELCEGGTLAAWQRGARRGWREVLALYVAAGRGLAAAHAAGLVHRDVKPDNILLGKDGRPRIADFGLARSAGAGGSDAAAVELDPRDRATVDLGPAEVDPSAPTVDATPAPPTPTPSDDVTVAGAVVGTPFYMAPEQLVGAALDARSDQFAFAVALYEALAGVAPFPTARAARAAAIAEGRLTPPRTAVPRRVLAPLARALAERPDARWPDMATLLGALERAARRRWWLIAAPVAAAVAAVAWWAWPTAPPPPGCGSVAAQVDAVWSPARRAAARAGGPDGAALLATADERIAAWTALRTTACRDLAAGGARAGAALPIMACLDQRLAEYRAVLTAPGADDLARADGLERTAPVALCSDGPRRIQREPLPAAPALAARVAADRVRLDAAAALDHVGRFDDALAELAAVTTAAEFPPLGAEVAYARATVLGDRGDHPGCKAAYRDALSRAAASHHQVVQVQALIDLAFELADDVDRLDERGRGEIDNMLALAEGTLAGMVPDGDLRRHLVGTRAQIRMKFGDGPGALADAEEAVRQADLAPGPRSVEALNARHALATIYSELDRNDDADRTITAALAAAEGRWPDHHAIVRGLLEVAGIVKLQRHRLAEARPLVARSLAAARRVFGADGDEALHAQLTLGVLQLEDQPAAAVATLHEIAAMLERRGATATEFAAMVHANLATAHSLAGDHADAAAENARAIATFEAVFGADHPVLIGALTQQAMIAIDRDRPADAVAPARRAVALATTAGPPDGPGLANPLATLALALALTGDAAEARALAERVQRLTPDSDERGGVRGEAELALALVAAAAGDRDAAIATATIAARRLARAGVSAATDLRRAQALLARLGR